MSTVVLRASDADRDQVAELLHSAYAEGRITFAEHDQRVTAALRSRTFAELEELTADLVPVEPARPAAGAAMAVMASDQVSTVPDRVTAVVSDTKRVGRWRVAPLTQVNVCAGSVTLDLTEAIFATPVVEINCNVFVGDVTIRVRPGTEVTMEANPVLGDTSVKDIGDPDPALPRIVVRGTVIVGDLRVRGPKKPPFWRRTVA